MHVHEGRGPRAARRLLTIPEAEAIIGGSLSHPSKMPCPAWGISASECRRGRRLAASPDAVCARCYARRGHYLNASVATAHRRRLEALVHPLWPDAMALLVDAYCRGGYFRWFDSGDLQSPHHLDMILWVTRRTSTVSHWLPTHEIGMLRPRIAQLPANLTARVSADKIGKPADHRLGLPTSTVHTDPGDPVRRRRSKPSSSIECLAYLRGHRCGSCRACWSPDVANVSYLLNAGLRSPSRGTKRVHLAVVA